jgi:hypothetical protein
MLAGTSLVSWMLHDPVACAFVASSVLLDPIVFLLCDPTVASVFVYKDPHTVVDLLMHFFLSRLVHTHDYCMYIHLHVHI